MVSQMMLSLAFFLSLPLSFISCSVVVYLTASQVGARMSTNSILCCMTFSPRFQIYQPLNIAERERAGIDHFFCAFFLSPSLSLSLPLSFSLSISFSLFL